jgi:hypothetical protein
MDIQHEIISFYPTTGSMVIRYFSEEVPDGLFYNIDIPLENGTFIGKERIDALIEVMKPVGQLERIAALKTVEIPSVLAAFILPQPEPMVVDQSQPIIQGTDAPPTT